MTTPSTNFEDNGNFYGVAVADSEPAQYGGSMGYTAVTHQDRPVTFGTVQHENVDNSNSSVPVFVDPNDAPHGRWRDGLFNCMHNL